MTRVSCVVPSDVAVDKDGDVYVGRLVEPQD